jgi:hypothetical protein
MEEGNDEEDHDDDKEECSKSNGVKGNIDWGLTESPKFTVDIYKKFW